MNREHPTRLGTSTARGIIHEGRPGRPESRVVQDTAAKPVHSTAQPLIVAIAAKEGIKPPRKLTTVGYDYHP